MWMLGSSQPELHGGQRFFFMTMAFQLDWTASGFSTRTHLPQPGLPESEPQQPSSSPSSAASSSDAAPVIQSCSPSADAPP